MHTLLIYVMAIILGWAFGDMIFNRGIYSRIFGIIGYLLYLYFNWNITNEMLISNVPF
jgi:hypothetical protein